MRIEMNSQDAEDYRAQGDDSDCRAFSRSTIVNDPQNLLDWLSNDDGRNAMLDRAGSMVDRYLNAAHRADIADIDLPERVFPAVFHFRDDAVWYADKGLIKALRAEQMICPGMIADELIFELTPAGHERLFGIEP